MSVDDIGLMRLLPNMHIIAPCDANEMEKLMMQSVDMSGPVYVRVGKGNEPNISSGKSSLWIEPGEVLIITTGVMIHQALGVIDLLKEKGISCGLLHLSIIKPINKDLILTHLKDVELVITVEEHVKSGGFGSSILEILSDHRHTNPPKLLRLGLPDHFVELYGSQKELLQYFRLDANGITQQILQYLVK